MSSSRKADDENPQPAGPEPSEEVKALTVLLRTGQFKQFESATGDHPADLQNAELRLADLRGAPLVNADLRGAYLRRADLRGLDLIHANLDGASIHNARISGVRFPRDMSAAEITMSLNYGTRMRAYRPESLPRPGEPTETLGSDPADAQSSNRGTSSGSGNALSGRNDG